MELRHDQGCRTLMSIYSTTARRRPTTTVQPRFSTRTFSSGNIEVHAEHDIRHDVPRLGAECRPPGGHDGQTGASLIGRRTFEVAEGYGGQHRGTCRSRRHPRRARELATADSPVRCSPRHPKPPLLSKPAAAEFVLYGAETIQQCLVTGLLDEIHIDLAAVSLGAGLRLLDHLADTTRARESDRCRWCGCRTSALSRARATTQLGDLRDTAQMARAPSRSSPLTLAMHE